MSNKIKEILIALEEYNSGKIKLRDLGVFRSERLTGEFGEWVIETLYLECTRADSTSQKGWDLKEGSKTIQVKTHAKGENNSARWTAWLYKQKSFDDLVILVCSQNYKIQEAYRISFEEADKLVDKSKKQTVLKWDALKEKKEFDILPLLKNHDDLKALVI